VSAGGVENGHLPAARPAGERAGAPRPIQAAVSARRRAQLVSGLRGLARPRPAGERHAGAAPGAAAAASSERAPEPSQGASATLVEERCDLCDTTIPGEHRHLLNLVERRIECACESCWALRSGDAEYRPTGGRTLWLDALELPDEVWASFQIPIGLAFFMDSTIAGCVVALYPSPGGATESELHFSSWSRMVELNPLLADLEPDIEGLIVNRLSDPPAYAIAPIDRCYALTGTIKMNWEGISGGPRVREAVSGFFADLHARAVPA
jgi:hypothetical protein